LTIDKSVDVINP